MNYFSQSLKNLRTQHGLTMQELADKADVSKSMICKIEREEVQPTIDVAARLAKALDTTLSQMLHAQQFTKIIHLPKDKQAIWEDAHKIIRRNISPVIEGLKIEWLHIELPPHTLINCLPINKNGVEKYILVTKGTLEVKVATEVYRLKKGDSLYFDAAYVHEINNPSKDPTEYNIVIKQG